MGLIPPQSVWVPIFPNLTMLQSKAFARMYQGWVKLGSLYQYQFEARVRPFYLTRAILHVRAPMGPSRYGECLASHNMGDLQLFPRQEGRKSRISLCTAVAYGGKTAPDFLLSERRKSGTRNFPADGYGGKAARATFPPLSQPFLYSTSLACDSINFWLPWTCPNISMCLHVC